jgi:hypothetical protein
VNLSSQLKGIAYAQKMSIERYSCAIVLNNSMAQRPCVIVLYDRKIELSLHNH